MRQVFLLLATLGIFGLVSAARADSGQLAKFLDGNQTPQAAGANNPLPVKQQGNNGTDYSINAPALPGIGLNFGGTGIYANYVWLATIPLSPKRNLCDVENTSGGQILLIEDDGTANATLNAVPINATIIPLAGGAAPGAQGGSNPDPYFQGRYQIYGPSSGIFVAINCH